MSLFTTMNVTCPSCGKTTTMEAVGSVNADRRPDLRDEILGNTFQQVTCPNCGASFRLEPEFSYLHVGTGQWIGAMPSSRMVNFREVEPETQESFDTAYGKLAPVEAQEVGQTLVPRLTFGWQGLREKLLLGEHALDDAIVEACKFELLRNIDEAPIGTNVELRLYEVGEDILTFLFLDTDTEETLEEVQAPRALYNSIAQNPQPYAALLEKLRSGVFVDMRRLFMGETQQATGAA